MNPKKKNTQGTRLSLYCIPNTKIHNTFVHPPYNSYYKTHDSISKSSSCSRTHATTTKIPVAKTCGKDLQRSVRHFQPELAHVIPMKLVVVVVVVIGRGSTMLAAVTKTHSFTSGQFASSQTKVLQKNLATNKNMML